MKRGDSINITQKSKLMEADYILTTTLTLHLHKVDDTIMRTHIVMHP